MSLASQVSALATRIGVEIKAVRAEVTSGLSGKVGTSRTISTTSPLTGGGDLSANRTLAVTTGTSAGTVALGDHTHADVPTSRTISTTSPLTGGGDLSANRTLAVTTGTSSGTVALGDHAHSGDYVPTTQRGPIGGVQTLAYAATIAVDATLGVHFRCSVTTTGPTISVPTGGTDGQRILFELTASGGARTVNFNTSYELGQNVTSRAVVIASGLIGYVQVINRSGTWRLLAVDDGT